MVKKTSGYIKIILDYPCRPSVITRILMTGRKEAKAGGNVTTEAEVEVMCFEYGGRSHESRDVSCF